MARGACLKRVELAISLIAPAAAGSPDAARDVTSTRVPATSTADTINVPPPKVWSGTPTGNQLPLYGVARSIVDLRDRRQGLGRLAIERRRDRPCQPRR
jgi:hypothetical protein